MDEVHGKKTPEQSVDLPKGKQDRWKEIQKRIPHLSAFPIFPESDSYEKQHKEEISSIKKRFRWKKFFFLSALFISLVWLWSSTSDLFKIPPDISKTYKNYREVKLRYFQNSAYWDSKREQFEELIREDLAASESHHAELLLETLTPEILISYLISKLKFTPEYLDTLCIQPKESERVLTLVVSKPEYVIWPLKIIVSLEIEVQILGNQISLLFTRLRRGGEDMPTGLAWAYFGSDLEGVKRLMPISSMKAHYNRPKRYQGALLNHVERGSIKPNHQI